MEREKWGRWGILIGLIYLVRDHMGDKSGEYGLDILPCIGKVVTVEMEIRKRTCID